MILTLLGNHFADFSMTDNNLFKQLFKHIRLLKHDTVNLRPPTSKIKPRQDHLDQDKKPPPPLTSTDKIFHTTRFLPRKTLHLFKRGQYNPEDTIDLHGMTIAQAKAELDLFITESYQANYFAVAVIHGKGRNTADKPILKNKVNEWLREYPTVMAFCSAPSNDGGAGKVYIMLEKSR